MSQSNAFAMLPFSSTNGMTVAELKRIVADWPETDAMGEPTEVWIQTGNRLSGPCMRAGTLNHATTDDGTRTADLLLGF